MTFAVSIDFIKHRMTVVIGIYWTGEKNGICTFLDPCSNYRFTFDLWLCPK